MSKHPFQDNNAISGEAFETIFRFNQLWTSIHVRLERELDGIRFYHIRFPDNRTMFVWKTREGDWEESGGNTVRAAQVGHVIDLYYVCELC